MPPRFARSFRVASLVFSVGLARVPMAAGGPASSPTPAPSVAPTTAAPTSKAAAPSCSVLYENFCDKLWSPEHLGNLDVRAGERLVTLRFGRTPNDLDWSWVSYQRAKLAARARMPGDIVAWLESRHYYAKLGQYLDRKPLARSTIAERNRMGMLYDELNSLSGAAIDRLAYAHADRVHPGFSKKSAGRMPTAARRVFDRESDRLEAAVYEAVWSEHPGYKEVRAQFEEVRATYLELVSELQVPLVVKEDWRARLRTLKLVIPGSDPTRLDASERNCARSDYNGHYLSVENEIVICAGYFSARMALSTLAHEVGHSLGILRSLTQVRNASATGRAVLDVRRRTCGMDTQLSCAEWTEFKKRLRGGLPELGAFEPPYAKLLSCLQRKEITSKPDAATISLVARQITRDGIEYDARQNAYLRLTKREEILADGSKVAQPAYLNPCELYNYYKEGEALNGSFTHKTFFVNEFRCCEGAPDKCLESSVEAARVLDQELQEQSQVRLEGRFSYNRTLRQEGYAVPVEEDLADYLGSRVLARILKKIDSVEARRQLYFASVASYCDEPSLAAAWPAEARAQSRFNADPHALGRDRRRRLLIAPIREALGCAREDDGETPECEWGG